MMFNHTNAILAREIRDAVVGSLEERSGFDHLFDSLDEETRQDIMDEIYHIVLNRILDN